MIACRASSSVASSSSFVLSLISLTECVSTRARSKQRRNEATKDSTKDSTNEGFNERRIQRTKDSTNERTSKRTNDRKNDDASVTRVVHSSTTTQFMYAYMYAQCTHDVHTFSVHALLVARCLFVVRRSSFVVRRSRSSFVCPFVVRVRRSSFVVRLSSFVVQFIHSVWLAMSE